MRSHHFVNRTNGANSRCHHTWFTISSSHTALTPKSTRLHTFAMPRVTAKVTAVPDPLGASIKVSVSDIWIFDCMIFSPRSGKSLYILFSCIAIYSSLVSTVDSSTITSSLVASLMLAGGISKVSGVSKSSATPINEVKSVDFRYSTSFLNSATSAFKTKISEVPPAYSHKLQLS
ncbi:hypothetical protein H5410_022378 [Solanum commersonii]|uniref:Uncharacterized protein n=1 Tax=Solanum commersonii TaxID=4109 RepID=A0A9J5ZE03_SOLCO|nr:hypothetical protein H5410_022378 [Solanum commersonii]